MNQVLWLFIVLLAILTSCTGTLAAVPVGGVIAELNHSNATQNNSVVRNFSITNLSLNTTNFTAPKDPCTSITCGINQSCSNGTCSCVSNTKKCGTSCIAQEECCTDIDCSTDKICFENACLVNNCDYNEALDKKTKACACQSETSWCDSQKKCIPKNGCCSNSECGRDTKCATYKIQANICYDKPELTCKRALEGQVIVLNNQSILFSDIRANASLILKTATEFIKTQPKKYESLNAGNLFVKEILPIGGVCVEDEG